MRGSSAAPPKALENASRNVLAARRVGTNTNASASKSGSAPARAITPWLSACANGIPAGMEKTCGVLRAITARG